MLIRIRLPTAMMFEATLSKFRKHSMNFMGAKNLKSFTPTNIRCDKVEQLESLFSANHIRDEISGTAKYVYGVLEEGYKDALQFANKLYAEKLLDPEYND